MMFYDNKSFVFVNGEGGGCHQIVYHLLVVDGGQRFQELTLSENG